MNRHSAHKNPGPGRRGSTLLIVLALLGLLTLLGLVFFTFANQERASAEYFTEAAKEEPDEVDNGMDYGMRTLLIGPMSGRRNSILFGRAPMVTNLTGGNDSRPNSGTGINLIYWDDPGTAAVERIPVLDQNRDGNRDPILPNAANPDSRLNLVNFVDAQPAHRGRPRPDNLPAPDNGTTYPDANSLFLSWKGYGLRQTPGGVQMVPIIIPSFMRPGMFRQGGETELTATNWYNDVGGDTDPGTDDDPYQSISFRPHRSHVYVNADGQTIDDGTGRPTRRFLDALNPLDTAVIAGLPGGSGGFPFRPPSQITGQPIHDLKDGELGIFTATPAEADDPNFDPSVYELDVDTDGDGIADSIWLDLDYPVLQDPATGAKYTFLYAVSVVDMDALVNLNVHGNLAGDLTTWTPVGGMDPLLSRPGSLSRSNAGLTPSEINPTYALMREVRDSAGNPPPSGDARFEQHERFFGHVPANHFEQANMEWFWLLIGRPELNSGPLPVATSDIADLFAGRFGEPERLYHVCTTANTLADFFRDAPKPGLARQDDNNDVLEGIPGYGVRGLTTPLDFVGSGRWVAAANPRLPILRQVGVTATPSPVQVPQYLGYSLFTRTLNLADIPLGPNQLHYPGEDGTYGTADDLVIPNGNYEFRNVLFDDVNESIAEPEKSQRPADELYSEAATIGLHMADADITAAADDVDERPKNLAPFAFDRPEIRQRFTTSSWSLKEHSLSIPFAPGVLTPFGRDGQPGWAGEDDDNDNSMSPDEFDEVGTWNPTVHGRSEDGFRAWLFNADISLFDSNDTGILEPNGRYEFPPRYGRVQVLSSREFGVNANPLSARTEADGTISEDPFRPQLRRLLRLEAGDGKATFGQLPLSINQHLDVERKPNQAADLIRGTLEYRPLTEHPGARNADGTWANNVLTETNITPCPYPPRDFNGDGEIVDEQEYWARRDRQKMARDIYVLLYTLGGGHDNRNYTGSNLKYTPGALPTDSPTAVSYPLYTQAQLRQMAQFAVNIVDAMDRDGVSTVFEYDKNLGDTIDNSDPVNPVVLRSGWNLDDDPATGDSFPLVPYDHPDQIDGRIGGYDGNYPQDSFERGVVYGVEKQDLALSEVLAIYTRELTSDHTATLYDDQSARAFLHMELQNMTSQDLPLATPVSANDQTAIYRIRRFNEDTPGQVNRENHGKLAFLQDIDPVTSGDVFTIATSDGNDTDPGISPLTSAFQAAHRPSDFYVDFDMNGSYNRIAPAINGGLPTATSAPTDPELQPRSDLDLVHGRDRTGVVFSVNGQGPGGDNEGDFLTQDLPNGVGRIFDPMNPASTESHVIVLERRANPHMPSLTLAENPWIEIDRSYAVFKEFGMEETAAPDQNMPPTDIENTPGGGGLLVQLGSENRTEPLDGSAPPNTTAPAYVAGRRNTLGTLTGVGTFQVYQIHFDRDFTSLGELLHVPLYGPDSLTTQIVDGYRVPNRTNTNDQVNMTDTTNWSSPPTGLDPNAVPPVRTYGRARNPNSALVSGANGKFLLSDFPNPTATLPNGLQQADLDNRWYLLFGMLEVPTRTHRQLGNPLINLDRVPGKINPNTIRHPQILAALLDDPLVTDLDTTFGSGALQETGPPDATPMPSNPISGLRGDWWQQFIASRDGAFTPPGGGHTLYIPGIPGSKPFEAFGRMGGNAFTATAIPTAANHPGQDLERTLFRTFGPDFSDSNRDGRDDNNTGRRLLELGTPGDHAGTSNPGMTPQTRHRLLSKILNNTTTTSNVFVVHMTIGCFEVYEDTTTGVVRIGGEYDITPGDGNPASFNRKRSTFLVDLSEAARAYDKGSNQFDYRRLIKQEVKIQ